MVYRDLPIEQTVEIGSRVAMNSNESQVGEKSRKNR